MAGRQLQRRISSVLFRNQSQTSSLNTDLSWRFFASTRRTNFLGIEKKRGIQTLTNLNNNVEENEEPQSSSSKMLEQIQGQGVSNESSVAVKYKAVSCLKPSGRHDLAMVFTCNVCDTRSVKTTCRESYEKGVVVARCDGCNNLHLIADRLGWFGEPGSVEDLLAARGEEVKKGSAETLSLTFEDLAGLKKLSTPAAE